MSTEKNVSTGSTGVVTQAVIPSLPGSYFLCQVTGASWKSRAISAGQAFVRAGSRYTHAGIYVGDGRIVHADMGAGVVEEDFAERYGHRSVLWSDAPVQRHIAGLPDWELKAPDAAIEIRLRRKIVEAARAMVGKDYAWLEYVAIAAGEFRWPGTDRLRTFIDTRGQLVCSGLVDRAYREAGIHLFQDRRRSGDVTPADLAFYDECWVRDRLADLERRVGDIEERLA